jgi:hypothetical protein
MSHTPRIIGEIIRNGIVFDLKNWDNRTMSGVDPAATVERLFILLEMRQVDHVLVGGVALLQYVEGRNTQDIDLIMALTALTKIPEIRIIQQDENFARGEFETLQIDILLAENPLFAHVQNKHSVIRPFGKHTIRTATVTGLILLKLYALPSLYRQGNFFRVGLYENDVATLLFAYRPDIDPILNELSLFMSNSDLQEIRNILKDIQARLARFGS